MGLSRIVFAVLCGAAMLSDVTSAKEREDMGHTGKSDRAEATGPMAEAPGPMAEAPGPAGGRVCKSIADKITAPDSPTKLLAGIAKTLLPKDFNALTDPEKELTVLLPPDAALNKVLGGFQQKKLSAEDAALVLKHHILTGLYDAKELKEMVKKDPKMPVVTTLAEDMGELTVGLENGKITFTANNTVSVTEADISACSEMQIIHKINTIIIPDDMELDVEALPAGNPALLPGNAAAGPGPAAAVPEGVLDDSAAPGPAPSPAESETSSRSSGTSSAHGISGVAVGTVVAGFMAVAAL